MQYSVKLAGKSGEVFFECDIEDGHETKKIIKEVNISLDTIDEAVKSKSSAILARVKIVGIINRDSQKRVIDIFKWSLEMSNEFIYRELTIDVYEGNDRLRRYIFPEMFVEDFKEIYNADGKDDTSYFELYLTQKEYNLKKIDTF